MPARVVAMGLRVGRRLIHMRPLTTLLSVEEAMERLLDEVRPVEGTERVSLFDAGGRVLAEDVLAFIDVPAFDRAAMDGYAVVAAATVSPPVALRCVEALYAGSTPRARVVAQTCCEIATGAPLPPGADAVVMVEHTRRQGDLIEIERPARPSQHVTRRGSDMREGERVLEAGTVLSPARVGAAAAVGRKDLLVYRRPRVKVGSTGNEVVEPGEPLPPGHVYNINTWSLCALFRELGCDVEPLPIAPDDEAVIRERVAGALDADLVVITGGSSVGEKDVLQDVFAQLGEIVFHGIAIKPGKPTMLARIQGRPVIGMPGYPTSCLSNAYQFLIPAIDRLARRPSSRRFKRSVPLSEPISGAGERHTLYTVRLTDGVAAAAFKESGAITSMSRADGYVAIPVGTRQLEAGDVVEVTLL